MATPYAELSETEEDSDRKEADRFLALLSAQRDARLAAIVQEMEKFLADYSPNRESTFDQIDTWRHQLAALGAEKEGK